MSFNIWFSFVIASILIISAPGPSVTYLVTTSAAIGKRAAYSTIPGIFIGDLAAMIISLSGMGALLNAVPVAYEIIKFVGVLYLIFLGCKTFKGIERDEDTVSDQKKNWKQGFLLTFLNPKSIIFFASFMPQFIVKENSYILQIIILGITYLMIGLINDFTYSFCADKIAGFLGKHSKRWIGRIGGVAMICTALTILVKSIGV
ncbi:LysE family translocator [Blautia pseudococcoides]|nr:LysE family translocator [Blautia pseudococcoides]